MRTLFKNANVITVVDENICRNTDILIEDMKIIKINRNIDDKVDQVINCEGLYAIPGLIESHMHIMYGDSDSIYGEESIYKAYVAYGVTSMRNMSGNMQYSPGDVIIDTFRLKQAIEAGDLIAPSLVNTSNIFDGDDPYQKTSKIASTIANAKYALEEALRDGADQIKVYEHLPAEVFDYICDWGKANGVKIVGHIPKPVDKKKFLSRAYTLEHTLSLKADEVDLMYESDTIWVPTIIVEQNYDYLLNKKHKRFLNSDNMRYILPNRVASWSMLAPSLYLMKDDPAFVDVKISRAIEKIRKVYQSGKEVAAGTDYPNPFIYPGISLHDELMLIKKSCKSNYLTLRAGTIMGAKALELEDRKGTLEVGKDADIVFLKKNPLNNIRNVKTIEKVVLRGRLFNRNDLDQLLSEAIVNLEFI
ncbi:MAG: amidohydrolase family protein [Clostridiales bacterium]|nr:amidohydrolase family protein [Clostridiales bacterium]